MDVRAVELGGMPAVVSRVGLHRRGRLRDLARRRGTRSTLAERLLADRRRCCRSGSARAIRSGSRRGSASTATTSTRRRRRSRRRSNGRSSRRGGPAAPGPAASRGRTLILGQIAAGAARRRVGLLPGGPGADARGHRALRRARTARRSARSPPAASGRASTRRWPWATCRSGRRRRAPGCSAELRGKMLPVTVAKMPLIAPGYKRAEAEDGETDAEIHRGARVAEAGRRRGDRGDHRARRRAARRPRLRRAARGGAARSPRATRSSRSSRSRRRATSPRRSTARSPR